MRRYIDQKSIGYDVSICFNKRTKIGILLWINRCVYLTFENKI